jgi:UDP-N-acetylmuramate-alanine ligase
MSRIYSTSAEAIASAWNEERNRQHHEAIRIANETDGRVIAMDRQEYQKPQRDEDVILRYGLSEDYELEKIRQEDNRNRFEFLRNEKEDEEARVRKMSNDNTI